MRVLLITENLGSGGAERQICGLAVMLKEHRYECRVITYGPNNFYEDYLYRHHVNYEYVPQLLNKTKRVSGLVKYLKRYKPTTVISFLPSVNISCCLARIFYRCNLIVSERNYNSHISLRDIATFNLYRLADYVVPNSFSQGDFICKNFSFLSKKVKTIVNFVDLEKFVPDFTVPSNKVFRIVTVARYSSQKNTLQFFEVVKQIKNNGIKIHFDWFGKKNMDESYCQQVWKEWESSNIKDIITLHDESDDIVSEYQTADAFLLPSLYEGYPNVVVEAMSCGLPILCSRVVDNPYIVTEGVNGFLFDPLDVKEMVLAINKMLSLNKEELRAMGINNRKKCESINSSNSFFEKYMRLIN